MLASLHIHKRQPSASAAPPTPSPSKSKSRGKGWARLWQNVLGDCVLCCRSLCKWFDRKQECADCTGSTCLTGELVQAAGFCKFLCKMLLWPACCSVDKTGYYVSKLYKKHTNVDQNRVSLTIFFALYTALKMGMS